MRYCTFLTVLVCLLGAFSCDDSAPKRRGETNVIKDYVDAPRDKARDAKSRLEQGQRKRAEQAETLKDE